MRQLLLFVALGCAVSPTFSQELPPRFGPLTKNERFRLVRVLSTPEMPATYLQMSAFSADGNRAVYAEDLTTGGGDNALLLRSRLSVWDASADWPREIELHGRNVTAISLSADGKHLLMAGLLPGKGMGKPDPNKKKPEPSAYLGLMELDTGKNVYLAPAGEPIIASVALAEDGVTALAVGPKQVKRWDLKAGKEIGVFQDKDRRLPTTVAFLPGGKEFLVGYQTNMITDKVTAAGVLRWDIAKPAKPVASYGNADVWQHIAVSRDGKRFATGDFTPAIAAGQPDTGPAVTLWDTAAAKPINTLRMEKAATEEFVTAVALADDGKTVLSAWSKADPAADDFACTKLIAWDGVANKKLWSQTAGYRARVPVLVHKDTLTIGGGPNLLDTWDIKTGKLTASRGGHKAPVSAVAVLADGDIVSTGLEGIAFTWRKGKLADKRKIHDGPISVLAVSRDQKHWLTGGADRIVKLHRAADEKPVLELKGHTGAITAVAFGKDGSWAVSTSADRSVKTWDLKTGKVIDTLTGHSEGVNCVAISPDEQWLATGSDDATIRVWPIKDGKLDADRETLVLEGHKKIVGCVAFTPDGKNLISGGQDNNLRVWDWAKEKSIRTIPGHKNWVTSLLFVDDKTILSSSDDLTICSWDWQTGKEMGRIDFGTVGDCPRCMTRLGADRLLVGTSDWLIYEFQMVKAP